MRRRTVLASAGGLAVGSLAGCLGPSGPGRRPLATNPVGQHLDRQPRLGRPADETRITLVSFEIPTCSNCASFHDRTVPVIRERWIETGEATMFARNTRPATWAVEAVHALEEVRLRAPALYWPLKTKYFENQGAMSSGNVLEKTREFLAGEEIDADAVVRAADERVHKDAIELDRKTFGKAVRIPATPTIFVFEHGEFVSILHNQKFDAFVSAVESHA